MCQMFDDGSILHCFDYMDGLERACGLFREGVFAIYTGKEEEVEESARKIKAANDILNAVIAHVRECCECHT